MTPAPKGHWFRFSNAKAGSAITLAILAFYVLPWLPFGIATFYVDGWLKLLLAAICTLGPFLQAITLATFFGSD